MKLLRDFWVYTHFHLASSALVLYILYAALFGKAIDWLYAIFLFLAVLTYYIFIRLLHRFSLHPALAQWYQKKTKLLLFLGLIVFIWATGMFFQFDNISRIKIIITTLIAFLYHSDIRTSSLLTLRNKGIAKIFLISFVWAMMIVGIPLCNGKNLIQEGLIFIHAFVFVLIWTIPFDIRDLSLDEGSLKTLPVIFKEKTFRYVLPIIGIYFLLNVIILIFEYVPVFPVIVFAFGGILLTAAIYFAKYFADNYFYTAFWVEGIPIWMGVFYVLIKMFLIE